MTTTALHTTREGWLTALAEAMRPKFEACGYTLPRTLRVGMSWPTRKAISEKSRTIGQCFAPTCSKDGTTEVFVSPVLDQPLRVADVLAHELIHAAIGT